MISSFLDLNIYRKQNRVIVQYYASGSDSNCLCPDCGNLAELDPYSNSSGCTEVCCLDCGTALAMISSAIVEQNLIPRFL